MATATRVALVVDDSKSARLVLRRMLEKYDITADTVESAADALDYLAQHRPDVIFMDHMMPGMDGFEAVRRIKANPQTVTIPVLMYTSKGGDLYLGQARALGAVGILPKTVAPAELYDTLLRLGLTRDRRSEPRTEDEGEGDETASERVTDLSQRTFGSWTFNDEPPRVRAEPPSGEEEHMRRLLEEMRVELRKDLLVSIDAVSRNVGTKLHHELDDRFARLEPAQPEPQSYRLPLSLLGLLALLLAAWNFSLHRSLDDLHARAAEAQHAADVAATMQEQGDIKPAQDTGAGEKDWQNMQWALNQSFEYPFDELALDGDRMELVDGLISRLKASGFKGKLVLVTHVGEFCLNGTTQSGFQLAPPEQAVDSCDFVGNPVQPTDLASAHQSLAFANYLDSLPDDGTVQVELVALPRNRTLVAYPERGASTRAEDWNRAAARNNRVLIRLEPAAEANG